MTLLLDTSLLIDIENEHQPALKEIAEISKQDLAPPATTFINHLEFLWGLRHKKEKIRNHYLVFINEFIILQTSRFTPVILCNLRQKYESRGVVLSLADLIIASLAIEHNMTLVTRDKGFMPIEELSQIQVSY